VRRIFHDFQPYQWEESTEAIAKRFNLKKEDIIRFDTNTSPFNPKEFLEELCKEEMEINNYPDTSYISLRRALSLYNSCDIDEVMVTNGADEALDIIAKGYIDEGDKAVISTPTYSMFKIVTKILGGEVIEVSRLKDFDDDYDTLMKQRAKLFFLCSPNNPTGNSCKKDKVINLLEKEAIIVIDEAYYEFSSKTFKDLIKDYENLIIVRTLSKAFSLAGIRVGYILANKKVIEHLNKVRPPNSLSVISLRLAEIALNNLDLMKKNVKFLLEERRRCFEELKNIKGIKPFPSEANFILFEVLNEKAKDLHKELLKRGLVLRSFNDSLKNFLRFTLNNRENNDKFLKSLKEIMSLS